MKKVLAIAPYPYLPFFSGGQKFAARFFENLGSIAELTVITVPGNDITLAKNYKLIPLLKKGIRGYLDPGLVAAIIALVKKEGFDTLICEQPHFAWHAFRVRKKTGIKVIIHTHNIEYQRYKSMGRWFWPFLKLFERRSFKKADMIYFITPEDRDFATDTWKIKKEKCFDLPFGIEINCYPDDRAKARAIIAARYNIRDHEKIIFFNGLLDYKPNLDALKVILNHINPFLLNGNYFPYKIIICGKRLPAYLDSLKNFTDKNIIYGGFTEDIATYCKASDLFLNPVLSGGGVKTKIVEAIAYGLTVISTVTGARGIEKNYCGSKLVLVRDKDWKGFNNAILEKINDETKTPAVYYEHYYWGNLIRKLQTSNLP